MLAGFARGVAGSLIGSTIGSVLENRAASTTWDLVNGATNLTDFITNTHLGLIRKEHEYMWKHGGKWLYSKFFDSELAE